MRRISSNPVSGLIWVMWPPQQLGPEREVDDVRAERGQQPIELARLLAMRPASVEIGPRHEAAEVRRDPQAGAAAG